VVRQGSSVAFWTAFGQHRPARRQAQARRELHKRRFAAPGRADDGNEFLLAQRQRYILDRVAALLVIGEVDVAEIDECVCHHHHCVIGFVRALCARAPFRMPGAGAAFVSG